MLSTLLAALLILVKTLNRSEGTEVFEGDHDYLVSTWLVSACINLGSAICECDLLGSRSGAHCYTHKDTQSTPAATHSPLTRPRSRPARARCSGVEPGPRGNRVGLELERPCPGNPALIDGSTVCLCACVTALLLRRRVQFTHLASPPVAVAPATPPPRPSARPRVPPSPAYGLP